MRDYKTSLDRGLAPLLPLTALMNLGLAVTYEIKTTVAKGTLILVIFHIQIWRFFKGDKVEVNTFDAARRLRWLACSGFDYYTKLYVLRESRLWDAPR